MSSFSRSYQVIDFKRLLADLLTVDLSLYGTPEGNKKLAQTLLEGVREKGFFYVKNFNISQERVDRQFAIGKRFYELPLEEKLKYVPEGLGEYSSYSVNMCTWSDFSA